MVARSITTLSCNCSVHAVIMATFSLESKVGRSFYSNIQLASTICIWFLSMLIAKSIIMMTMVAFSKNGSFAGHKYRKSLVLTDMEAIGIISGQLIFAYLQVAILSYIKLGLIKQSRVIQYRHLTVAIVGANICPPRAKAIPI